MLQSLLDGASYAAHGYCLLWNPWLVTLHALSDFFIFAAYAAIPVAIWIFIRQRPAFPMNNLAWLFVAFILLCGATHLVGLITLWWPVYEAQGLLKFVTAGVSVATALLIFPLIPKAVALPTPDELVAVNRRLKEEAESHRRTAEELASLRDKLQQNLLAQGRELDRTTALLATISEATAAFLYVKDPDGRIVYANPALIAALAVPDDQVIGHDETNFLPADEARAIRATDRRVLDSSGPVSVEERVTFKDGRIATYQSTKIAQRDASGRATGLIGVSIDVSERKRLQEESEAAAERYRARTEELETLLEVIPAAVFIAGPHADTMVGNRLCHELLKVPTGGSVARSDLPGIRPEHFEVLKDGVPLPRDELPVRKAAVTGQPAHDIELELAFADGERRTILGNVAPLFGPDGRVRGSVGAYVDITARKRAEDRVRLLLRELSHRLTNAMSLVQAMARMTLRGEGPIDDKLRAFDRRLAGLGESARLLAQNEWTGVPLDSLARRHLELFDEAGDRILIDGPPVELNADSAQAIGLALHELATNAVKYGALSLPGGRIALTWTRATGRLDIVWRETGGPPPGQSARTGFGTLILQTMMRDQCGAVVEVRYDPAGLVWQASMPAEKLGPR